MLHVRIQVAARRSKCRAFTLGHRMNVNGMFTRRKIFEVETNAYALRGRREVCRADGLPLPVMQLHMNRLLGCGGKSSEKDQH